MPETLTLTGERTLPGIAVENYWFRRHEAAYEMIAPWCRGAVVLEAGCGEGYGAERLADSAHRVVGVDYDEAAVAHVAASYPRIATVRANLARLPLRPGAADVVVSLQVIEHLWDQAEFLADAVRVLRPAGTVIISTPNRLTFSPAGAPVNPFHTRELAPAELVDLLTAAGCSVTRLLGLRHGRRLRRLDRRHGGSFTAAQLGGPPDTWSPRLRQDVAAVRAADFVLTDRDVDSSLDLIAIAVATPR